MAETISDQAELSGVKVMRVLAIDDNTECLDLLRDLLQPMGFEVVTMTSPIKALERFKSAKEHFDVVLVDYFMPQLDGAKTFDFLRIFDPAVKVILISGGEELRLRQILAQYPFDGVIRKPFRLQEALQIVRQVIDTPKQKGKVIGM